MGSIEEQIERKGLELGFSNVGFTAVRDYPEYLEQAHCRSNYGIFVDADDALLVRLSKTRTLNPWARSVVCATLGFASIDYPAALRRSVARAYLARAYSPQPGTVHAFQVEELASFLEGLGMRVERDQFRMPQRLVCAEAGITTYGNNNFAYTEQDGSFVILVTFLVDRELEPTGAMAARATATCWRPRGRRTRSSRRLPRSSTSSGCLRWTRPTTRPSCAPSCTTTSRTWTSSAATPPWRSATRATSRTCPRCAGRAMSATTQMC